MIDVCPFCGHTLEPPLARHGITSCDNCNRLFDHSPLSAVLSAAWFCRRTCADSAQAVRAKYGLDEDQVRVVQDYVVDRSLCHDEFLRVARAVFMSAQAAV